MLQDVRQAIRSLRRSPGFAGAAILIFALGIGANTAIFSVVDAVLLHPLPGVGRPAELVDLQGDHVSFPLYESLRDEARGTVALAAQSHRSMSLVSGGEGTIVSGLVVSDNYFDILRVRPLLGRFFDPTRPGAVEPVAVVSHGLWSRRFGGDPSIVGRPLVVNGVALTVLGVAPRGFRGEAFGVFPDVWVPIGAWPPLATGPLASLDLHSRNWGWLSVFGRLDHAGPASGARATLTTILRRDAREHGEPFPEGRWSVVPSIRSAAGSSAGDLPARALAILGAAVLAALLIACANLANLLLARAAGREREIALRKALGASRGRIARQVLAESIVLSIAGAAAGLLVASWTLATLNSLPLLDGFTLSMFEPRLSLRALAFAAGLASAVGIGFGLLPAWAASREPAAAVLAESSSRISRRSGLKGALLAAQVALCLALLATSGLLGRSLFRALSIDLGLRRDDVTLARVDLGLARYDASRALAFVADLPSLLVRRPGVTAASWTSSLPLSGSQQQETFEAEGFVSSDGKQPEADVAAVGPGYFRALTIPVLAGREFTPEDRLGETPVVVVNRAMAARYFHSDAVGRRITIFNGPRIVVGVVADTRSASLRDAPVPQVWAPVLQAPPAALSSLTLLVRAHTGVAAASSAIREEIRHLDPALPVSEVEAYDDVVLASLFPQRLGAALLGVFGGVSLLLASVGIYAVVSWSTRRRTREFGIRMALGARASDVRGLVLRQMAISIGAGAALGLGLSALAGSLMSGALYGVAPADPLTLGVSALTLGAAALLAAWLPARRASRIDPMAALRSE